MVEHWISARKALEIVIDDGALLVRLRNGRLKARADTLFLGDERRERVAVPQSFWRHDIYYDPHFDWHAGDFVNGSDEYEEIKAIGVSLDAAGVLEMVPFDQRGLVARGLSVAGSPDWITAQEAKRLVYTASRANVMIAEQLISEQAKLGFVVARAVLAQCQRHGDLGDWTWEEREWDVPTQFWADFLDGRSGVQDFAVGHFSGSGFLGGAVCSITLSGVHFHRPSLEAFLRLGEEQAPTTETEVRRGRRPSYDWPWAVNAIWGRLSRSELVPESQADIEKALMEVLKVGKVEPGESTVRPYASTIYDEYMRT